MPFIQGYEINEKIDSSSITEVHRGIRLSDQKKVVFKWLASPYPLIEDIAALKHEYGLLEKLKGAGTVNAIGCEPYENSYVIVMEQFGEGNLKELIQGERIPLIDALRISIDIVENLEKIHSKNIIHKDINPTNILWDSSKFETRIIDFNIAIGLRREDTQAETLDQVKGSLPYISPEQTGRMNRAVDYRADYYSLGVTLYELFTGVLPFESDDAMTMVHAHIAKSPKPPHEVILDIPIMISKIIMHLLAKASEDRYQSLHGLKQDLKKCVNSLQTRGIITDFQIGSDDIASSFHIPEKLYGRELELKQLMSAFDKIVHGDASLLLVSGYSGMGKSSIINDIHKPVVAKRGYFINGKFDQLEKRIPYTAISMAFEGLVAQLLAERTETVEKWKAKILKALGRNASLIIDIVPSLEKIIGTQPKVVNVPHEEAQSRFYYTFANFLQVIASDEHPLVLFLDDMQWADTQTLSLLEQILSVMKLKHLLIICAYRDNEVHLAHPLMLTLKRLKEKDVHYDKIELPPISIEAVTTLLTDLLGKTTKSIERLAELCYQKTHGNPFFLIQFLQLLWDKNLITFNLSKGIWQFKLEKIKALQSTDNVADLMTEKIQTLPKDTQEILKYASCLGNDFDLSTISMIMGSKPSSIAAKLWEALKEGLVAPLDQNYQLISDEFDINAKYRFVHDRIREAVFSLLSSQQKKSLHLKVGRLLFSRFKSTQEKMIFEITNHFNYAVDLIKDINEKVEVAELNLLAAIKSKDSIAYDASYKYCEAGLQLVSHEQGFISNYEMTLNLYTEAAESAYQIRAFDRVEELGKSVIKNAKNLHDKIKVFEILIQTLTAKHAFLEAEAMLYEVIGKLGMKIPKKISRFRLFIKFLKVRFALRKKSKSDILSLPDMTDSNMLAICRLVVNSKTVIFYPNPRRAIYTILSVLILSLKYGYNSETCVALSIYAMTLCVLGRVDEGYYYGEISQELVDRDPNQKHRSDIYLSFISFIYHWKVPIRKIIPEYINAFMMCLEEGNTDQAVLASYAYPGTQYMTGVELSRIQESIQEFQKFSERYGQAQNIHRLILQMIDCHTGKTEHPYIIDGKIFNYNEAVQHLLHVNDRSTLCYLYFSTMSLCFCYKKYELAYQYMLRTKKYIESIAPLPNASIFTYYECLIPCKIWNTLKTTQKIKFFFSILFKLRRLKKLGLQNPNDKQHRYLFAKAEFFRILGFNHRAATLYDEAIECTKRNEFLNESAIGSELAADFYFSLNYPRFAMLFMQDAHYLFKKWGATAKVLQIEERFPELSDVVINKSQTLTKSLTETTTRHNLDFLSAIKASQAIAKEIILPKLLQKLMRVVVENAGAEKGYLILEDEGNWTMQASMEGDKIHVLKNLPNVELPESILHFVINTKQHILINDASDPNPFINDICMLKRKPKSILCIPLINQDKVKGVLYFENDLSPGVFTTNRLELLSLLSTQILISINNANFYKKIFELNKAYERFVPHEFLNLLEKKSITDVQIGDHTQKDMTVLFCDIRDFTSITEKMTPGESFAFINDFLQRMEPEITKHSGFIDKYIGDAIMAIYHKPDDAIESGLGILKALNRFNQARLLNHQKPIRVGIGINSGPLMLGTVGSKIRIEGTVVSDVVNLASRIEGLTKIYNVPLVVTDDSLSRLDSPEHFSMRRIAITTVKGKRKPVIIYEVFSYESAATIQLKSDTKDVFEEGLDSYLKMHYEKAKEKFYNVLQINKNDKIAKIYYQECQRLLHNTSQQSKLQKIL